MGGDVYDSYWLFYSAEISLSPVVILQSTFGVGKCTPPYTTAQPRDVQISHCRVYGFYGCAIPHGTQGAPAGRRPGPPAGDRDAGVLHAAVRGHRRLRQRRRRAARLRGPRRGAPGSLLDAHTSSVVLMPYSQGIRLPPLPDFRMATQALHQYR